MEAVIGSVVEGKVTGITKFGAFVALPSGQSGMVHISEVAATYVNDISEHLKEGQQVTVKIIGIDERGRINLSIKKALPPAPRTFSPRSGTPDRRPAPQPGSMSFEDKLKQFMQSSESKMSDLKQHIDKKGGPSRRGRK